MLFRNLYVPGIKFIIPAVFVALLSGCQTSSGAANYDALLQYNSPLGFIGETSPITDPIFIKYNAFGKAEVATQETKQIVMSSNPKSMAQAYTGSSKSTFGLDSLNTPKGQILTVDSRATQFSYTRLSDGTLQDFTSLPSPKIKAAPSRELGTVKRDTAILTDFLALFPGRLAKGITKNHVFDISAGDSKTQPNPSVLPDNSNTTALGIANYKNRKSLIISSVQLLNMFDVPMVIKELQVIDIDSGVVAKFRSEIYMQPGKGTIFLETIDREVSFLD